MEPTSLSASAAQMFETCEARYKASYMQRAEDVQNKAALLGTACHEVLELWVSTGQYKQPWPDIMAREKAMHVLWDMTYWEYFSDEEQYSDGWGMLRHWLQREDWEGRAVISTEQKKTFEIPTSRGKLPFNYIIDRMDQLYDGSIDVVDYKSVRQPITHDRMPYLIQPRTYAVAAMIEYPEAPAIWVTYDLLRYNTVSVKFTRDDCVATWKYLKALCERIYESDGSKETLNPECRFCVRKHECKTLRSNIDNGGILSFNSLNEITDRLAELTYLKSGIDKSIAELQEQGLTIAEAENVLEWETETAVAKVTASGRRNIDSNRASAILGPDIMSRYGKIGVGDLDTILKEEDSLTDSQRSQLKQLVKKKFGAPRIDVKPKSPFEEE